MNRAAALAMVLLLALALTGCDRRRHEASMKEMTAQLTAASAVAQQIKTLDDAKARKAELADAMRRVRGQQMSLSALGQIRADADAQTMQAAEEMTEASKKLATELDRIMADPAMRAIIADALIMPSVGPAPSLPAAPDAMSVPATAPATASAPDTQPAPAAPAPATAPE